jgi:hypothetical protein
VNTNQRSSTVLRTHVANPITVIWSLHKEGSRSVPLVKSSLGENCVSNVLNIRDA